MNQEITNPFQPVTPLRTFDEIRISLASPERILSLVLRRDQEARDHQLPHVQARA